jgi:hypothetical protein
MTIRPYRATDAEERLLERIPRKTDPLEHRDTVFRELSDQISSATVPDIPCTRAGCDAKIKWLTLGRATVCAWCRSHGSRYNDDLRCIPAEQFFASPFGTLDHLLERAGRSTVRTLVHFCCRNGLIDPHSEVSTHLR